MIYVFLANGFEEIEAVATIDLLRRAGKKVVIIGVGNGIITGSHGISIACDFLDSEIEPSEEMEAIVLPGGMPGTLELEKSLVVKKFINYAASYNLVIGAICAAPSILGHMGLLKGKKAVCYEGFEDQLLGATVEKNATVIDGNIITACSAGASIDFGIALVNELCGSVAAEKLEASLLCDR